MHKTDLPCQPPKDPVLERENNKAMNESTVSSKFQADLRKALPGCEVIKHADKSMIGLPDASITFNKRTIWVEYKLVVPRVDGSWDHEKIAAASPTQFQRCKNLAQVGHCIYLFWVVDHAALRKRVGYVVVWNPVMGWTEKFYQPSQVVEFFRDALSSGELPIVLK